MLDIKTLYNTEITKKMSEKFGYKNTLAVPKVNKVVINVGLGESKENPKFTEIATKEIIVITGQKPALTKAKKAISGFKIRQGDKVGLKVTLRGRRMYDFLERLVRISLPRIRDFRGLKIAGFDSNGNYNIGIKEHIVFPEIQYDKVEKIFGLQVTINTTAKNNDEARELLTLIGFPFEKIQVNSKKSKLI